MDITAVSPDVLEDLKANPWHGSAVYDYSIRELIDAGLRPPLVDVIKESRDNPAKFYGNENHPFVRFTASPFIEEMRANAKSVDEPVLLVAMGSYAPMHEGHLDMMEAADRGARKAGWLPIGAVFSLHCEDHVRAKILPVHPKAPIRTETRYSHACAFLPDTLASGTPTFIDQWDARMPGGPRAFTDIMTRLSNILVAAEIRGVTPVAVFGSDNGISMRAFSRHGMAICVVRPKHEKEADPYIVEPQMKRALRENRVLVVPRECGGVVISSTEIRNRSKEHL